MAKAKPLPCKEHLSSRLEYNAETGSFTWLDGRRKGCLVKLQTRNGYSFVPIRLLGKTKFISAHRLAWFLFTGDDPFPYQVDHINLDRSNNTIGNLRLCTQQQNNANSPAKRRKDGASNALKGAYKQRNKRTGEWTGRWFALIVYNNKSRYLGTYDTPELAHMAYCKAAAELHGEFARAA